MTDVSQVIEAAKILGVAFPLVAILVWQLREAQTERAAITKQFVDALTTSVSQNTSALTRSAEGMTDLASAVREGTTRATQEHDRLIDAIGKAVDRKVIG